MHELSIALSLVEQIEAAARRHKAIAVTRVTVIVGRLSGVDPEALLAAFPLAAEETLAAGAALEIEVIEARAHCRTCGKSSIPEAPFLYCGCCGSTEVEVEAGRDLLVKTVEIDVGVAEDGATGTAGRSPAEGQEGRR